MLIAALPPWTAAAREAVGHEVGRDGRRAIPAPAAAPEGRPPRPEEAYPKARRFASVRAY